MTNGYAVVEKNGQYGYIKQSGTIAIEPRYEEAYTFAKNGLARIKRNGKYGFINAQGEEVIKAVYLTASDFDGHGNAI